MRLPRPSRSTVLRASGPVVGLVVGVLVVTASPAAAAPLTSYEMPFPCGETWTGTTRPSHSPSPYSVDWNRPDDVGDPVVAAAAGAPKNPSWYDNLRAHPDDVSIEVPGGPVAVRKAA